MGAGSERSGRSCGRAQLRTCAVGDRRRRGMPSPPRDRVDDTDGTVCFGDERVDERRLADTGVADGDGRVGL